jgi:hypothetical protein
MRLQTSNTNDTDGNESDSIAIIDTSALFGVTSRVGNTAN